jgi:hypothetical protein
VFWFCLFLFGVFESTDLPKDAPLRIGVKHKVECARKSRNGDELSMHYTGEQAGELVAFL